MTDRGTIMDYNDTLFGDPRERRCSYHEPDGNQCTGIADFVCGDYLGFEWFACEYHTAFDFVQAGSIYSPLRFLQWDTWYMDHYPQAVAAPIPRKAQILEVFEAAWDVL